MTAPHHVTGLAGGNGTPARRAAAEPAAAAETDAENTATGNGQAPVLAYPPAWAALADEWDDRRQIESRQIAGHVLRQILDGKLKPDEELPSVEDLIEELGALKRTARSARLLLAEHGIAQIRDGKYLVASPVRAGGIKAPGLDSAEIDTRIAEWSGSKWKYLQIAGDILRKMRTGEIPSEGRLPSNADLVRDWRVSMGIAIRAKHLLAEHGYACREDSGNRKGYRSLVVPRVGPRPGAEKIAAWRHSKDLADRMMAHLAEQIIRGSIPPGAEMPGPGEIREQFGALDILPAIQALQRLAAWPGLVTFDGVRYCAALNTRAKGPC